MLLRNLFIKKTILQKRIYNLTTPDLYHRDWFTLERKKCLMICHDQDIDRRIIQQAMSLDKIEISTLIICLSHDKEDKLEIINGIFIHRIGLKKTAPDCPIFWQYQRVELFISSFSPVFSKFCSNLNSLFYKARCRLLYNSKRINHPLPFDECFYRAGYLYKSDIVIAHDLPALVAATRVASRRKIPIIYDAHELYSEQKTFSSYQQTLLNNTEAVNTKKCDKVFTVSESLAEIMAKRYKIIKPSVLFNASPYNAPYPNQTISDLINFPKKNNIFILFQGGVFKNRNIENLVKGFLLLSNYHIKLIFLGQKDKEFVNNLKKIIGSDLGPRIFFLNSVSQDELLDLTATADFGVIPYTPHDLNTKYCLPNKLFEFIQAGIPFIYNKALLEVQRIANELNMAELGIDFSTPKTIKTGIERVLNLNFTVDKEKLEKQKRQFCWENEEKKLLLPVKELLDLNDITNLATISDATPSIKEFEFEKILKEDPMKFYAAASTSNTLPHYIICAFSTPIKLTKIKIIWESYINYASKYSIEYFDTIKEEFIELVYCKDISGANQSVSVNSEMYFSKIRLMVYETKGQKRLLIRNLSFFGHTVSQC